MVSLNTNFYITVNIEFFNVNVESEDPYFKSCIQENWKLEWITIPKFNQPNLQSSLKGQDIQVKVLIKKIFVTFWLLNCVFFTNPRVNNRCFRFHEIRLKLIGQDARLLICFSTQSYHLIYTNIILFQIFQIYKRGKNFRKTYSACLVSYKFANFSKNRKKEKKIDEK